MKFKEYVKKYWDCYFLLLAVFLLGMELGFLYAIHNINILSLNSFELFGTIWHI